MFLLGTLLSCVPLVLLEAFLDLKVTSWERLQERALTLSALLRLLGGLHEVSVDVLVLADCVVVRILLQGEADLVVGTVELVFVLEG